MSFPNAVETSLTPQELADYAYDLSKQKKSECALVIASLQALLTVWPHIKELSISTNIGPLADRIDKHIRQFRDDHPDTNVYKETVEKYWPACILIHTVKNATNLIPLLQSAPHQNSVYTVCAPDPQVPINGEDKVCDELMKELCLSYAGIWVVLDQLLVYPATRKAAESVVQTLYLPLVQLILSGFA
jgi:hypothetical protein